MRPQHLVILVLLIFIGFTQWKDWVAQPTRLRQRAADGTSTRLDSAEQKLQCNGSIDASYPSMGSCLSYSRVCFDQVWVCA